jgi:hypothetical protein
MGFKFLSGPRKNPAQSAEEKESGEPTRGPDFPRICPHGYG